MEDLQLIATTTAGLEACVKRELLELGFPDVRVYSPGRILFRAGLEGLVRANLWLRTAERVLLVIGSFDASDFGELFDRTRELPWQQWIPADGKFPVQGRSHKSQLSSVPACQKIVKKAIVENLLAAHGTSELPETGATYSVEIAIREDVAMLTIDTSGAGLHKRGYRAAAGPAPLKETLAAAMVQLSFWNPDRPLIDPFCGSGTIPIEAALIGRNIAPGLNRPFAAEEWPAIPNHHWQNERQNARDLIKPSLPLRIIGTDIEPKALSLSSHHAELAGVAGDIHFQCSPFDELTTSREYGCVICNPPYGRRFEKGPEIAAIYRSMPDVFRRLKTWSFYVLTSVDLEATLGQSADRRRKLYNGRIECTYYQFHGPRPPKNSAILQEHPPQSPEQDDQAEEKPAAAFGGLKINASAQVDMFVNRLRKNARHLRRWPDKGITCYRLYDRDIPEIPLAVDIYEGRLHIAEYERPHDRTQAEQADWIDLLAKAAGEVLDIPRKNIYVKRRQRQKGAEQYRKFSQTASVCTVHEGGLKFEVNLSDYLDTGLFLDHRVTREMVRKASPGKRMLNLFAYTGAFSVYAAAGGAAATKTVDLSNTYLDWAGRNLLANGYEGPQHKLVRADAMKFLREHAPGEHYDIAVIDPPTFSNSKGAQDIFDVQRDYRELLLTTAKLMPAGGVIYFSTNFRRFKLDPDTLAGLDVREISRQTIPDDFRNKRIHRCWRMTVR
ncbi:MAG: bifunctional 23S rRNA (guanine(2069)-N(7))-methyltransferase RlmK/23S rRNA (guanine(2445)-N(2))-methyltransferase RlmL [Phycisphaerae bacterium]|nr:bifunctional 23S rRNA (guanine(2069)-N(7))-methyltransferase RlmK/23S rRNA (guanine(2445)-N(2))-methyltransferase RlmL [Phycisphaerae bacterium]